jgi:hypothetical protein
MNEQKKVKAMLVYEDALKLLELALGTKGTSTTDLDRMGKSCFGSAVFKGVFPVDGIPKLKEGQLAVANLDPLGAPGSHWVGLCGISKGRTLVYDSFGRHVFGDRASLKYTEDDAEEKESEKNCGQRAIAFLFVCVLLGPDYGSLI